MIRLIHGVNQTRGRIAMRPYGKNDKPTEEHTIKWKEFLKENFDYQYAVADKLMDLVTDDTLNWKPATGENWMTVGQLLMHLTNACGACVKGFVTGDWGMPGLPVVSNVAEAKRLLSEDKALAFQLLADCTEDQLENQIAKAPWDPMDYSLGRRMLEMANHLQQHKGQLFYYLKLQGLPVNTMHLWGA